MENRQFSTVHLNNLGVSDAYALFRETVEVAEPVQNTIGEMAKSIYTRLVADTTAMGNALKLAQKSTFTAEITNLDDDRDNQQNEIKRDITYFAKSTDAAKKAAADRLKIIFTPYWDTTRESLNTETKSIDTLMAKYKADKTMQADAALIGIDTKIAALEAKNNAFAAAYKSRTSELGNKVADGTASNFRPAATKSYNDFCAAIEQAVNYAPNDTVNTLFNTMRRQDQIDEFLRLSKNPSYLTGLKFDTDRINFTSKINEVVKNSDTLIFATPSPFLKMHLKKLRQSLKAKTIVTAIKGIVPDENLIVTDYFQQFLSVPKDNLVVLAGPCHVNSCILRL